MKEGTAGMTQAKDVSTDASEKKSVNHSSGNKERYLLRLPLELRSYIQAVSYKSCRSMNSEILMRLSHSLANFDSITSDDLNPKNDIKLNLESDNNLDSMLSEEISKLSDEGKKHLIGLLKEI